MEERNERNAGKNRTPQKQHAAKIKNRYFSTHTHTERKKKESKIHGTLLFSPEKKRKKKFSVDDPYRTTMAPKVPLCCRYLCLISFLFKRKN
jgi:hypothetical protein